MQWLQDDKLKPKAHLQDYNKPVLMYDLDQITEVDELVHITSKRETRNSSNFEICT